MTRTARPKSNCSREAKYERAIDGPQVSRPGPGLNLNISRDTEEKIN